MFNVGALTRTFTVPVPLQLPDIDLKNAVSSARAAPAQAQATAITRAWGRHLFIVRAFRSQVDAKGVITIIEDVVEGNSITGVLFRGKSVPPTGAVPCPFVSTISSDEVNCVSNQAPTIRRGGLTVADQPPTWIGSSIEFLSRCALC
jgi:hypothetical protein